MGQIILPSEQKKEKLDSCTFGDIVCIQHCLKTVWGQEEADSNQSWTDFGLLLRLYLRCLRKKPRGVRQHVSLQLLLQKCKLCHDKIQFYMAKLI